MSHEKLQSYLFSSLRAEPQHLIELWLRQLTTPSIAQGLKEQIECFSVSYRFLPWTH